jgi:hypothetical protein
MKRLGQTAAVLLSIAICMNGEQPNQPKRIAIYPFQDTQASAQVQVGHKLYDILVNRISDSGAYQVIDRQFLDQVITEQRLPHGLFDEATAVRIGKLLNVSLTLFGTITTLTVNPDAGEDSLGTYGTVTVSATARLIATETGTILKAPTATQTARGIVRAAPPRQAPARECAVIMGHQICGPPPAAPAAPKVEIKTLNQLLDEAVDACGRSLASEIASAAGAKSYTVPLTSNTGLPMSVIGVSDGLTYIDKGSTAGLKVGQVVQVFRISRTGLTNPEDGTPVTRKNQICTLTLSDVEDRNSSGSCTGTPPVGGDRAELAVR